MTQVILHIGMHKTGTSTIQGVLSNASGNFFYPLTARSGDGDLSLAHHKLAWTVIHRYSEKLKSVPSCDLWKALRSEIAAESTPFTVILSSEFFWPARTDEIRKIAAYLEGYDTRVVMYVRNHWDYLKSSYKQHVKGKYPHRSLRKLVEEKLWMFDYEQHIKRWSEIFDLDLRIYDKAKKELMADFAKAVGCSIRSGSLVKRNISPSNGAIHMILLINMLEPLLPINASNLLNRIRRNISGGRWPGGLISKVADIWPMEDKSDRAWFREKTAEMRESFVQNYVNEEDRKYFNF